MAVQGICRLCRCEAQLRESHIIPRFVFDWQKRTSSTGYLRLGQQINRRQQDGLKHPFLCAECEARFNAWETPFATHMFLPYHEQDVQRIEFDSWLLKFCVSISWRAVTYLREQGHLRQTTSSFWKATCAVAWAMANSPCAEATSTLRTQAASAMR
jgi:hypothetical protein